MSFDSRLFFQSVPGSALMNILGGALYGHFPGCILISVLTAMGSTLCYLLSWLVGRELVDALLNRRILALRKRLKDNKHDLFFYLLFTRMVSFYFTGGWRLITDAYAAMEIVSLHAKLVHQYGFAPCGNSDSFVLCNNVTGTFAVQLCKLSEIVAECTLYPIPCVRLQAEPVIFSAKFQPCRMCCVHQR